MEPTTKQSEEGVKSHYRQTKNKYGVTVSVPVIDVRDGIAERMIAMNMVARSNRSKYIQYNQYHQPSRKNKTNATQV